MVAKLSVWGIVWIVVGLKMYSIHVFLKDDTNIEFFIGSAYFLKFLYQPARLMNLELITHFDEENDLKSMDDFCNFGDEIGKLVVFWVDEHNFIDSVRPTEFIKRLIEFNCSLKKISVYDISYISIF